MGVRSEVLSRQHLLVQIQEWKQQKNVWNMFKVNTKDTRTTSMTSFWCLYWQLRTDFGHCSGGSIDGFEHVNAGWILTITNKGGYIITDVAPNLLCLCKFYLRKLSWNKCICFEDVLLILSCTVNGKFNLFIIDFSSQKFLQSRSCISSSNRSIN